MALPSQESASQMLEIAGFFAALIVGGTVVGNALGVVLGATLGRVLQRKQLLNTFGQSVSVGLAAALYREYLGMGSLAPAWLFPAGVAFVAFLLHRFEGRWWWAAPALALVTAYVLIKVMALR
jgi:hypothetical protein